MEWRNRRGSSNIEDRRGIGGKGIAIGGGGIGVLILVVVVMLCGGDPSQLLQNLPTGQTEVPQQQQPQNPNNPNAPMDEQKQFVSVVLADTEEVWRDIFKRNGSTYREPELVLFTDRVQSACGVAGSSTGPFYCPGDQKLYLNFGFFRELKRDFGADGDFAQAYVIAHEVGHHVQTLLGTMQKAGRSNEASVRIELQADCYAGVFAYYEKQKGYLSEGDAEEAINAAGAVGDDRIQTKAQGYTRPETFTHGSSRQRIKWFSRGFQTGDIKQCDSFR
jgi:uncharacterized protein